MPKVDLFNVVAFQDMLKNPGKFYFPGHSDMGIPAFLGVPIPKTLGNMGIPCNPNPNPNREGNMRR